MKQTPAPPLGKQPHLTRVTPVPPPAIGRPATNGSSRPDPKPAARSKEIVSDSGSDGSDTGTSTGTDTARKRRTVRTPPVLNASLTLSRLPSTIPPLPYKLPPGFTPVSAAPALTSKVSELFAPANLAGKQIWHITAPSAVPIGSIREVVLEKFYQGEPALVHAGAEYGFSVDEDGRRMRLLLPDKGGEYRPGRERVTFTKESINGATASTEFSLSLNLRQLIRLPDLSARRPINGASRTTKKTPREQPKGLKMHFRPLGTSSSIILSDSDAVEDSLAEKAPSPRTKKRKHREPEPEPLNSTQETDLTHKKKGKTKKHKHRSADEPALQATEQGADMREREQMEEPRRRRETSEERARRKKKKEKRRKRELELEKRSGEAF
ncbi:MAG: hypothetical protein M1832_003111 [Thelocarpon impressellum]|nr:MAG: hypothetical protein M1832_003111 [Thelocarpon impressellum]